MSEKSQADETKDLRDNSSVLNASVEKCIKVLENRPAYDLHIIDEYKDREQRKLNLIFHKIPESNQSEVAKRKVDDIAIVQAISKELERDDLVVINAVRLGRKENSKTRLLKVQVDKISHKMFLLIHAKNLRDSKDAVFKKVFITPDLSPKEREVASALRTELYQRREAGEKNIVIHKGKIVSKQAHKVNPEVLSSHGSPDMDQSA